VNGDGVELDIELGLRLGVLNAIEDRNRADYANKIRRTGAEPPPTKVLELLLAFAEEKLQKAMREGHTLQGARALCDLEVVLRDLVRYGHAEFGAILKGFEGGWRRRSANAGRGLSRSGDAARRSRSDPRDNLRDHSTRGLGELAGRIRRGS
jgi:hypothetical protein